jgi:hypothetical protein
MAYKPMERNIGRVLRNCYNLFSFLDTLYDATDAPERTIQVSNGRIGLLRKGRKTDAVNKTATNLNSKPTQATSSTAKGQRGWDKGMNIYVITYDRPVGLLRNNEQFLNTIRSLGPRSARIMERTWLVGTNLTPDDIQKSLQPFLNQPNDRLLVNQLTYYQGWLDEDFWEWINQVSQEYLP